MKRGARNKQKIKTTPQQTHAKYIGNKTSLAIKHEINLSLEIRYCGVPLYRYSYIPTTTHCLLSPRLTRPHIFFLSAGKKWATVVTDCCDCQVAKCIPCPAPAPRADVCPSARPANCYTYTPNATFNPDESKCYESSCTANPTDAPDNEVKLV